jgi:hypothetical protein
MDFEEDLPPLLIEMFEMDLNYITILESPPELAVFESLRLISGPDMGMAKFDISCNVCGFSWIGECSCGINLYFICPQCRRENPKVVWFSAIQERNDGSWFYKR